MSLKKLLLAAGLAAALPTVRPRDANYHVVLSSGSIDGEQCTGDILATIDGNNRGFACNNLATSASCFQLQNFSPYGGGICQLWMYDQPGCVGNLVTSGYTGAGLATYGNVAAVNSFQLGCTSGT